MFLCPGCELIHSPNDTWTFNGDFEKPTFEPSILVTAGDQLRCHSFVTDGNIKFLDDCNHALAGETREIPEWPYGDTYD